MCVVTGIAGLYDKTKLNVGVVVLCVWSEVLLVGLTTEEQSVSRV